MKTRLALILAVTGAAATMAVAQGPQTQGSATWNLQYFAVTPQGPAATPFSAVSISGPGGQISEGQGVLFRLSFSLSCTPGGVDGNGVPVGSPLTWAPSILVGSSGAGGLGGLWGGDIDIVGSGTDVNGTWSANLPAFHADVRRRTLAPYTAAGAIGFGTATSSSVTDIQPAQFGAIAASLDHGNNLVVWTGMWVPNSYAERTVTFTPQLGSLGLETQVYAIDNLNEFGFELPIALRVTTNFGAALQVPIVPAPSSLALLGLGGLIAARRRR
jgi:hypothetical protein